MFAFIVYAYNMRTPKMCLNDSAQFIGKRVLFVIAHPDDEAMFFGPSVTSIVSWCNSVSSRDNVHLLCLSTGSITH